MANNLYSDDLEQLNQAPTPRPDNPYDVVTQRQTTQAPPPPTRQGNAYDGVIQALEVGQQVPLRNALADAATTTPDRAAEVQRLSTSTGIPADMVERNFEFYKQRDLRANAPISQMQRQTPALAEWAAAPQNAKVASDDLEQLGALEWLLTAPQRAVTQGVNSTRYALLRSESLLRPLAQADHDQLEAYKYGAENGGQLGAANSWFRGAVTGLMRNVPMLFGALLSAGKYGAAGATEVGAAGAAVGSLLPGVGTIAGALAGGAAGFSAGELYGSAKFFAKLGAGAAYDEFSQLKDENGQVLDPNVAKAAALGTGLLNGLLMTVGVKALADRIPGLDKLTGAATQGAVAQLLRQPTIRAALGGAVKSYAGGLTEASAAMVAQRAVEIMGAGLAKTTSGQPFVSRTPEDVASDLAQSAGSAVRDFSILSAFGPLMQLSGAARRAQSAQDGVTFFKALGEGVANSKTAQRLPDAAQTFLAGVTKDGPIAVLYQPTNTWTAYWQSKGVDPAKMAQELTGKADALDAAERTGQDLAIPTERYAVKLAGTEHNAFFSQELRLGPEEMNGREAKAFVEEAKAAATETPAAEPRPIHDALMTQLEAAGVERSTAEHYAALYDSAIGSMADRAGVDPQQLFDRYGLKIERPDLSRVENQPADEIARQPTTGSLSFEGALTDGTPPARVDTAAHEVGQEPPDRAGERPRPAPGGSPQGSGNLAGAEHGGLPTRRFPTPDHDEVFARHPLADNQARLTPEVRREVAHMLDEMETFQHTPRTWTWLEGGEKSGNAAGGAADIVAGTPEAEVYKDVRGLSPVNKNPKTGEPAHQVRGTGAAILAAGRKILESGDIHNNLAEGIVRVAERRAAEEWHDISPNELPRSWATPVSRAFVDDISEAFDKQLHVDANPADAAAGDLAAGEESGSTDFDPTEFGQGLFDELDPAVKHALREGLSGGTDILDTGEQQARLPGDVGAVRDENIETPAFDAPFTLTAEVARGGKGRQGDLFQERRGFISIGRDRQMSITLLERADLSTFLHETGHLFLEVSRDLANHVAGIEPDQRTPEQQQLLADFSTLTAALVDEDHAGAGFSVTQHEQFARTFEAYLMEGKAPSVELRPAFARFRAWLIGVYRSLTNLRVSLTPEVRRVLDRMVASDRMITEAEAEGHVAPMFTTPEDAGMTDKQFGLYRSTVADASTVARETLDRRLLSEVQREQTAQWKASKAETTTKVEEGVHQQPVYQAIAAIRRGTRPDGTPLVEGMEPSPLKLSRAVLVERYGAERLSGLRGLYVADGGMDPNTVAQLYGFSSGDHLLRAIEQAEPMKAVIEREVTRRMLEEHGSILLDGTIHEKARAAVANDTREKVIRAELKALWGLQRTVAPFERVARREGADARQPEVDALRAEGNTLRAQARGGAQAIRAALPPAALYREMATTAIADTRIGDIRPQEFWSASRRAAQQAIDSAARQQFGDAIVAKQHELLNLALYREAERAKEDVQARVVYARNLGKVASLARLGLAGAVYRDQVIGVLDRFSFREASRPELDRKASLANFVRSQEAQGVPVELPAELLDEARRIPYQQLTLAELQGVTDGLKQIEHLARLKNRLLAAKDQRDYGIARDGIVTSIEASGAARPSKLEILPRDQPARKIGEWFASHTKLAEFVARLDGYVDGGPLWSAFMRPINEAATAQAAMHEAAAHRMTEILREGYSGRELAHFHDRMFIPAINDSLSREARIAVALNWGNEGNRQRLVESGTRKWNADQVQAILNTLDARDLKFVQDSLDHVNSFWPQIVAKQERIFGVAPEKVEAASWNHALYGEQRGGYYPIAYDGRLSVRQGNIIDADATDLQQHANYAYATTKRGYTEARQERVNAPVRLELSAMYEHVESVIHDLTHHEMLIDVGRLMADRSVQNAILSRQGDIVYKQMRGALLDIALGTRHATTALDRAANYLRTGTTIASLGWNIMTPLHHLSGVFNGMARVGPVWVARGMSRIFRDASSMEWSARWIESKSEQMRLFNATADREINDLRATLRRTGSTFDNILRTVTADHLTREDITNSYTSLIGTAIKLASMPTWIGMYEKSMAGGETEARAIAMADQAVTDAHGGGQMKDLAQVSRGPALAKLFTTFYTYGSIMFNQTSRAVGETNFRRAGSVGQMLGNLALIYVAPAVFTVGLARAVGRENDDTSTWSSEIGREMLGFAMNTQVGIRELANLAQGAFAKATGTTPPWDPGYEGPVGLRAISQMYQLAQQVEQGEADRALLRATEEVAGVLFKLPLAQVQRSVDGFAALDDGTTHNPAAVLVGPPRQPK